MPAIGFINPWTGEEMGANEDEDSITGRKFISIYLSRILIVEENEVAGFASFSRKLFLYFYQLQGALTQRENH